MNLIGEQFVADMPNKSKKGKKIVVALIILVLIAIITVVVLMFALKEEKVSMKIDGEESAELKKILRIEENNKIYIPIKDIAGLLGYESYYGNYINKSEDSNECYIETTQEVAGFEVGSDKIEKINTSTQEATYFIIDEPVKMIEGKLYTTPDGIRQAYNVKFYADDKLKNIKIETMQYLVEKYKNSIIELGYKDISTDFNDEKAILKNMAIIKDEKGQYGVLDITTDKTILETKYSKIKYIPVSNEFLVESNGKIGIKTSEGIDRIKLQYDSIEQISQDLKRYIVKKDDKYGMIDQNENIIIPLNCDKIGIDPRTFAKNNIKNKYVILDKIVPVMKNDLWGLYDIDGNFLTDYQYNSLGCTSSKTRNVENVLIIPKYGIIIGCKDKKYYFLNKYGEEVFNGINFDEIYMTVDLDKVEYFVVRDSKKANAIDLIERLKEQIEVNKKDDNKEQDEEKDKEKDDNEEEKDSDKKDQEKQDDENQDDGNEDGDNEDGKDEDSGNEDGDNEDNEDEDGDNEDSENEEE